MNEVAKDLGPKMVHQVDPVIIRSLLIERQLVKWGPISTLEESDVRTDCCRENLE